MRTLARCLGISACMLGAGAGILPAVAANGARKMMSERQGGVAATHVDPALDALLTREMNDRIAKMSRLEGQTGSLAGRATLDLETCRITVYLPAGFVPEVNGGDFEDQLDLLSNGLWWRSREAGCEGSATFLFNGMDIDVYFPEDSIKSSFRPGPNARAAAGTTLISAGHGYYFYRKGEGDWRYQRDPANGIVEDEITPDLAAELQHWLESRSGRVVERARSTSQTLHGGSNQPWWKVSSRYHLQALLPDAAGVWNSLPNSTGAGRERDEDIRSRPLYANHLGVDDLIHLHTNGDSVPATRGARVYYHVNKPQDIPLGTSILCYMKELVTSQEGYESFPVNATPHAGRHGENRLATMPSVIVEAAFHTNPDDALALQDPVFRTAAMKGVEKGYRLWREGKGCTPLAIQRVTDVTLPPHTVGEVEVHFEGHPRFPVTMEVTSLECPPGSTCDGGEEVKKEPLESPLTFEIECGRGDRTRTSLWQTVLRDDDGVASAPAQHRLTCTGPATAKEERRVRRVNRIGMW